jgi:hypothetical protein
VLLGLPSHKDAVVGRIAQSTTASRSVESVFKSTRSLSER